MFPHAARARSPREIARLGLAKRARGERFVGASRSVARPSALTWRCAADRSVTPHTRVCVGDGIVRSPLPPFFSSCLSSFLSFFRHPHAALNADVVSVARHGIASWDRVMGRQSPSGLGDELLSTPVHQPQPAATSRTRNRPHARGAHRHDGTQTNAERGRGTCAPRRFTVHS